MENNLTVIYQFNYYDNSNFGCKTPWGGAIKKFLACMNKTRMLYGTVFVTISSHWLKIADILDGNKWVSYTWFIVLVIW